MNTNPNPPSPPGNPNPGSPSSGGTGTFAQSAGTPPGPPLPGAPGPTHLPGGNLQPVQPAHLNLPHLKLNAVQKFLLWLSKTDIKALAHCTPEAVMGQTSLGAMVLLTGVLALGSSFFTVWTIVQGQVGPVLIVPLIYASAVMLFDRELVGYAPEQDSSTRAKLGKMAPRFVFAGILGYAIAIPVELKVMERRIEAEIRQVVEERNKPRQERIQAIRMEIASGKEKLKEKIKIAEDELGRARKNRDNELYHGSMGGGIGRGVKFEAFQSEVLVAQKEYNKAIDEHGSYNGNKYQAEEIIKNEKEITDDYENLRRDMLARIEALHRITENNFAAAKLAWLLTLVFMLFEMFPMVLKFFTRYNEYHAYLHVRREINIQKAHVFGNYALNDIEANPRSTFFIGEYTDFIQGGSEDSAGEDGLVSPSQPTPIQGPPPMPAAAPWGIPNPATAVPQGGKLNPPAAGGKNTP